MLVVDGTTWAWCSSILDHSFALLIKNRISEWNFLDVFGFTALVEFGSQKKFHATIIAITHKKPKDLKCWLEKKTVQQNCKFYAKCFGELLLEYYFYEKRNVLLKSFSDSNTSIKISNFGISFFQDKTFNKKLCKTLLQLWSWSEVEEPPA